jgi:hypothetical protein
MTSAHGPQCAGGTLRFSRRRSRCRLNAAEAAAALRVAAYEGGRSVDTPQRARRRRVIPGAAHTRVRLIGRGAVLGLLFAAFLPWSRWGSVRRGLGPEIWPTGGHQARGPTGPAGADRTRMRLSSRNAGPGATRDGAAPRETAAQALPLETELRGGEPRPPGGGLRVFLRADARPTPISAVRPDRIGCSGCRSGCGGQGRSPSRQGCDPFTGCRHVGFPAATISLLVATAFDDGPRPSSPW